MKSIIVSDRTRVPVRRMCWYRFQLKFRIFLFEIVIVINKLSLTFGSIVENIVLPSWTIGNVLEHQNGIETKWMRTWITSIVTFVRYTRTTNIARVFFSITLWDTIIISITIDYTTYSSVGTLRETFVHNIKVTIKV